MQCTLNLHSDVCKLYHNKNGEMVKLLVEGKENYCGYIEEYLSPWQRKL